MLKALFNTCLVAACLVAIPSQSAAQEMIHAVTGTVSSIDKYTKIITVMQDNGTTGFYQEMVNPKTRVSFDRKVEAESTAAPSFDKQGAYVIVFYFGQDSNRTVVALKSLGQGPFAQTNGTVTRFDGHAREITVQDETGKQQTFKIDPTTVAEGTFGVTEGMKFHADKGDHVRIVSSNVSGAPTALFVRDL